MRCLRLNLLRLLILLIVFPSVVYPFFGTEMFKEFVQVGKKEEKKSVHAYDVIFNISSIADMLVNNGWPVVINNERLAAEMKQDFKNARVKGALVAVSGLFNRGKTFVLNQLADLKLPLGFNVPTQGISFTIPLDPRFKGSLLLVDTAGMHSPIQILNDMRYVDRRSTEGLLKEVVFDLVHCHIVVVNQLTWPDQLYIRELLQELEAQDKAFKEVFVVHNLREITESQKEEHIEQHITPCYPGGEKKIISSDPEYYWWNHPNERSRHVFLVNDTSPGGKLHNNATFKLLREWLLAILAKAAPTNLFDTILNSLNKHLKQYLIGHSTPEMEYTMNVDGGIPILRLIQNPEEFSLKPMSLSGFALPVHEDIDWKPAKSIYKYRDEVTNQSMSTIIIDIPGANKSAIKIDKRRWPTIVISGERVPLTELKGKRELSVEMDQKHPIRFGKFAETFILDNNMDPNSMTKVYSNGVLNVTFLEFVMENMDEWHDEL